ncbi:hypothetical protein HYX04_04790 [Candidatus Woesearchaeota archaeon]|nr:hypothetical protein [Candidatus Woesearchaeota archaeon]
MLKTKFTRITERDIYKTLDVDRGKTALEVQQQLAQDRGIKTGGFKELLFLSLGKLYTSLLKLERQGYVYSGWRENTPPEVLEIRGGARQREYFKNKDKPYPEH